MALSDSEKDTFGRLTNKLQTAQRELKRLDAYYEGVQRLERLGLAVPEELAQFVTMVNWPRITCDAVEERIDLEGFRLPGQDSADDGLWDVWQANDLDEESQLAHLDALALKRSFVCVGSGESGPDADREDGRDAAIPLVTVESPFEMTLELNPRTRQAAAALKAYRDNGVQYATLYLPDQTIWLESGRVETQWTELDRDQHGLGVVPVVPITNRSRIAKRDGVSEMADVISLTDAAARALTNAQIATEVLAVPQRYVLGASKGDFIDREGNPLTAWEAYFGAVWALNNPEAKVGQFSAADLGNFTRIVEHYATLVSGVTGLPMRYFGSNTANPPSADGIRADEARLVKKAERRCRAWGGSWERVMRLVKRIQDGAWNPDLASMETLWRDPATPTRAQQADATVKLYAAGLLPREGAWEDLDYSATRRKKLAAQFEAQAEDPLIAKFLAETGPAAEPAVPGAPVV